MIKNYLENPEKTISKMYVDYLINNKNDLSQSFFNIDEYMKNIKMNDSIAISEIQKENSNLQTRIINNILNKSDFKHYLITNFPQNHIPFSYEFLIMSYDDCRYQFFHLFTF